jgi:hypothetical protein
VQQVSCSAGWRDGDGVLHHMACCRAAAGF